MKWSVPEYIASLKPYVPGKPIEELEREYGIEGSIKLASNENPLGPSPMAVAAIQEAIAKLHRYPDGSGFYLVQKLAARLGVRPGNLVLGNGSDEIIGMLTRAFLQPGDEAVMPRPSFLMYDILVRSVGASAVYVPLKSLAIDLQGILENMSSATRMIFLTNPNNPTGTAISGSSFKDFLRNIPPAVIVVVDEAYIEFVTDPDCLNGLDYVTAQTAVVTLRTFSKAYGLAGLRIGYGVMAEPVAQILHRVRQPFNTNSLAQIGALAAIDDEAFLQRTLAVTHEGLKFLYDNLDRIGLRYYPTQANFFMIEVNQSADSVFEKLLREGVIVRSMTSYGYPDHIRVNVGLPEENIRFITALEKVL
jgi:histidinol-phosphate aminotransferase